MFFTDYAFFVFLPVVFCLYWLIPFPRQNLALTIASYTFYCWNIPWIGLLKLVVSLTNWYAAIYIEKYPNKRKSFLVLSIAITLSILVWFKYTVFIIENLRTIFPWLPIHLSILLPAGISFFTFQALAYTIDVYRKELPAEKNIIDFMLFVSFFPQLVAGPIERSGNLLKQVSKPRVWSWIQFWLGVDLIIIGYVKKVVVADNVATYVNMIFDLKSPSTLLIFIGGIAFSIQLLADFSAYTDIARGCAKILGFNLMENFNNPYLSKTPSEFWRRWHISLSNWIRDYVYISLGGSRVGLVRWIINMLIVWFLCGLWHGAGWNFILWGLYWGLLIIIYRILGINGSSRYSWIILWPLCYFLTVIGWILFRTKEVSNIYNYLSLSAWHLNYPQFNVSIATLFLSIIYAIPLFILLFGKFTFTRWQGLSRYQIPIRIGGYFFALFLIMIFSAEKGSDFYYFQF